MKKITLLGYLSMAVLLFFTSCNQQDSDIMVQSKEFNSTNLSKSQIQDMSCGETTVVSLIAGQHIDVGTVTVSNNETYLFVTYQTTGDWYLTETHLYVGAESDIPYTKKGNPKIGHFTYSDPHGPTQSYTYKVDLSTLDASFAVIAHAVVNDDTSDSETAFGCGDKEFPGKRWGCYFEYTKQDCEIDKCIDAYGYKDKYPVYNTCFSDYGFSNWGWSNGIGTFDHRLEFNGILIPLFVDGEGCGVNDATEIGYVKYKVSQEFLDAEEKRYVTITYVITDSNYVLDEVNLYLGIDMFPQNNDGTITSSPEDYTYHQELDGASTYKFNKLPWPAESDEVVNAIQHAKVSLVQI